MASIGKIGIAAGVGLAMSPIGNFVGSALAANTPGSNTSFGGAVGGATAFGIGAGVTTAALNPQGVKNFGLSTMQMVGGVSMDVAEKIGGATIGLVDGAIANGPQMLATGTAMAGIGLEKYGSAIGKVSEKFVRNKRPDEKGGIFGEYKLSALGAAAVVGTEVIGGGIQAFNSFNQNRMGTHDGQIMRATPTTPSYANNGGATGDLVFSLHQNRKG